jgi:apolipoprotein N-acyltransferase
LVTRGWIELTIPAIALWRVLIPRSPSQKSRPRGCAAIATVLGAAIVLSVVAHPPWGLWPLAFAMLAPVAYVAERRSARATFGFTYAYTAVTALVIVRWLVHALAVEYEVERWAAWTFTALLVGSYAVVPAAGLLPYAALRGRAGDWYAPLLFAALWTLGEWLRATPLGLPWILAAHPLAFVPVALQTADLGGTWAVGFVVAAVNAGIGVSVARRSARPLVAPAAVLALAAVYGGWRLAAPAGEGEPIRVGLVQASIPQHERFQPGSALRNTLRHAALTRDLTARHRVDLVVWSETAVDDDLDTHPALRRTLRSLVDATGVPLVTGAPRSRGGRPTNSVVLFTPGVGLSDSYDKQRLVPFSETDPPIASFLGPLIAPVVAGPGYVAGRDARLLHVAGVALATPVCFEITYPGLVRRFRDRGAQAILNLSNDAWFGRGGYAEMHLAHVPFRAVELRSWIARATNTGISAAIDPKGRVVSRLPLFEEGVMVAELEASRESSFYARHGDLPVLALLGALVAGAIVRRLPRSR